jgi:hypothetical protein
MFLATPTPISTTESDPTLLTLVPPPSRLRSILLVAAGALTLSATWASPRLLQPLIDRGGANGTWLALGDQHQVLVALSLDPDVWPHATLSSIDNVAGAEVSGAWLLPGTPDVFPTHLNTAAYATGGDYLRAQLPKQDWSSIQLPQTFTSDSARLIILWTITDCSQLKTTERVQANIKTALTTSIHRVLTDIAMPGFDLAALRDSGTCPAS